MRRYFIVSAISAGEEGGTTADCPTGWSGAYIGRDSYVVMHPGWNPGAPRLREDIEAEDLEGLTDEQWHDVLPIEVPVSLSEMEVQEAADAAGLNPLTFEQMRMMQVSGV